MVKKEKVKQSKPVQIKTRDNFEAPLEELLEAGCHFGHQTKRWFPKMASYIWQSKDGIHIFDLAQTAQKLKEACMAVQKLIAEGGTIVFVGTKKQAKEIIKEEAIKAGVPYVSNRWLGGTITNWEQIKKSILKLKDMKENLKKGEYDKYTKREVLLIQKEIDRLEESLGGLAELKNIPEAIFIVDPKREIAAVKEAKVKGVKIFAIIDTNCDPTAIDYVIPANDDAVRSIKLIVEKIASAASAGIELKERKNASKP